MQEPKLKLPTDSKIKKHLDLNPYSSDSILISVESNKNNEYPSYIETPVMLIGEKFKKIMSKYQPGIAFKMALLLEREREHQEVYYAMTVPRVDCLIDNVPRDPHGFVKELILDEAKIGNHRIFRVKGYKEQLVVRLDVAESLLRRGASGISFNKIKTSGGTIK